MVSDIRFTQGVYFVTMTVTDWIDIFTRPRYKQVVVDSLAYCQQHKGLVIYAWVLMTNHLHIIASSSDETDLPWIIRDFKRHTTKKILEMLENDTQESRQKWILAHFHYRDKDDQGKNPTPLWQASYYVETIETQTFFIQKMNYIHDNPVRQGFVNRQEDYPYSSATNYRGHKGLLEVDTSCLY